MPTWAEAVDLVGAAITEGTIEGSVPLRWAMDRRNPNIFVLRVLEDDSSTSISPEQYLSALTKDGLFRRIYGHFPLHRCRSDFLLSYPHSQHDRKISREE